MNSYEENPQASFIGKLLFRNAMKNNWKEVIEIYKSKPEAEYSRITRSGDTALHIAISDGRESTVEVLVGMVRNEALRMKNDAGNTPLHLAAYLGNNKMCSCIAARDPTLIGIRNQNKDTPLFLAVLHGMKDAVEVLVGLMGENIEALRMKNDAGNTPLHLAAYLGNSNMCSCIAARDPTLIRIINEDKETPLFLAVLHGRKDAVEVLVGLMGENDEALRMENEVGNTALHLAAYLGNSNMCRCIATRDPTLIGIRNKDNETPLFLAVLHGKKDAFLCLNTLCKNSLNFYGYSRGKDGDTILHSAIDGEYFEIAVHIIRDYKELLNSVNEKGLSPLHILANKPSVFRSGSHIRGFQQLFYYCIPVDDLTLDASDPALEDGPEYNHKTNPKYPENYQTCIGIFLFARNIVRAARRNGQAYDEERSPHQLPIVLTDRPTQLVPENCTTCFNFVKFLRKAMLLIIGLGTFQYERIREKKKKHVWSVQIMRELIDHRKRPDPLSAPVQTPGFDFTPSHEIDKKDVDDHPISSSQNSNEKGKALEEEKTDTPLLIAAKSGIIEMVEAILERFPMAINDVNSQKKNIVLLAVENRQPHIYKFLQGRKIMKETIFRKMDKFGNSALHLAAMMGDKVYSTNAALQLQWEYKWYQYVMKSMPLNYFARHNMEGKTASEIFNKSHLDLLQEAGRWLKETSTSCSVVAALVATVSFATSATIPGGVAEKTGAPTLQHEAAFSIFAISSLAALCFSVTSIIMFLAIFTASYNEREFFRVLQKLLVGLGSLFVSLSAMLVSFCASQFLIMREQLKYAAIPLYVVIFIVMTCYVIIQFPWYFDVALLTMVYVPPRTRNSFE